MRKIIGVGTAILAVIFALTVCGICASAWVDPLVFDNNFDNKVDISDVTSSLNFLAGNLKAEASCFDDNVDGISDISDVTVVLNCLSGHCAHQGSPCEELPGTCDHTGLTGGSHCTLCGEVLEERSVIPASHRVNIVDGVPATCTTAGSTDGLVCPDCGTVIVASGPIPALGHQPKAVEGTPATCVAAGKTASEVCERCGETVTAPELIPPRGHTPEELEAVMPTCTEDGLTAGYICGECDEILVAQQVLPALGHREALQYPAEAPTCEYPGKTASTYCTVCNQTVVEQVTLPALGHTVVNDPATEATCTGYGMTAGTHCSTCGTVFIEREPDMNVPPLGHDFSSNYAGTCCSRSRCGVCNLYPGNIVTFGAYEQDNDPDNGTEPIEWLVLDVNDKGEALILSLYALAGDSVNPTAGTDDEPIYWSNSELRRWLNDEFIYAWNGAFAYYERGYIARSHVTPDGNGRLPDAYDGSDTNDNVFLLSEAEAMKYLSGSPYIRCAPTPYAKATGNIYTNGDAPTERGEQTCFWWLRTVGIDPNTCEQIDVYGDLVYMGVRVNSTGYGIRPALRLSICALKGDVHEAAEDPAVAPTCTEPGLTAGSHCAICGKVLTEQTVVEALGHGYANIPAVKPTCTEPGLTAGSICVRCGDVATEQAEIEALGHDEVFGAEIRATCEENGRTAAGSCARCGIPMTASTVVAPLGHTPTELRCVAPTCTNVGYTAGVACSVCAKTLVERLEIPATGHTPVPNGDGHAATCYENGMTDSTTCSVCHQTVSESQWIARLPHTLAFTPGYAPSCTENGYTDIYHCTECGYELWSDVIFSEGHRPVSNDDGYEATCTEAGLIPSTHCALCGAETSKAQPTVPLGHAFVIDGVPVDAPCLGTSYAASAYCARCGETFTDVTVPELGHNYENGVCTRCGALEANDLSYTLNSEGTAYIVTGMGGFAGRDLYIPAAHNGLPVNEIADYAFFDKPIKSVRIPSTVRRIGREAFGMCWNDFVYIDDIAAWCSIEFVDDNANPLKYEARLCVGGEEVTDLVIPEGVTMIGSYAFYNSRIASVTVPEGVTYIGSEAFFRCDYLRSVSLPASLSRIGACAFEQCSVSVVNVADLAAWCAIELDDLYASPLYVDQLAVLIGTTLCVNGTPVTDLVIPDGVTEISDYAFAFAAIRSVTIPSGVKKIGNCAFLGTMQLRTVEIPASVTEIGAAPFVGSINLIEVINRSSAELMLEFDPADIPGEMGEEMGLLFILLGLSKPVVHSDETSRIVEIDGFRFISDGETNFLFEYVGDSSELVFPTSYNGEHYVIRPMSFFLRGDITSAVIAGDIEIGPMSFLGCFGLKQLTVGAGVSSIGDSAFLMCMNLAVAKLGGPVSLVPLTIGHAAFADTGLITVELGENVTAIDTSVFENSTVMEIVNNSGLELSPSALGVNEYSCNIHSGISQVVNIDGYLFAGAYNELTLLRYVGSDTDLVLPSFTDGTTYIIGDAAFSDLMGMGMPALSAGYTSVVIPDCVTSIGMDAFRSNASLRTVVIGDGCHTIGWDAFDDCPALECVTVGASVSDIGYDAFYKCVSLKTVYNRSSLPLVAGSEDYGGIALYADEVIDVRPE